MNVYFELADSVVGPGGKYFAAYDHTGRFDNIGIRHLNLLRNSERAWGEYDDGAVYLIKDRSGRPHDIPVDMKEFMFIKLRSVAV